MDIYLYKCHYCGKDYKPNRRNKQKFCSNSCRVNSFNKKKKLGLSKPQIQNEIAIASKTENQLIKPFKIETMSMAGVGNAVVGTVAVNLINSLLTSEENKPATKKDLMKMMGQNKRFYPIKNAPQKIGFISLYDMQTQCIVYQMTAHTLIKR